MRSPRYDPAIGIVPAIAIADVLPAATQQMLRDLSTAAFLQRYLGSARGQPWVTLQGPSPGRLAPFRRQRESHPAPLGRHSRARRLVSPARAARDSDRDNLRTVPGEAGASLPSLSAAGIASAAAPPRQPELMSGTTSAKAEAALLRSRPPARPSTAATANTPWRGGQL